MLEGQKQEPLKLVLVVQGHMSSDRAFEETDPSGMYMVVYPFPGLAHILGPAGALEEIHDPFGATVYLVPRLPT